MTIQPTIEKFTDCLFKWLYVEKSRVEAGSGRQRWDVFVQSFSLLSTAACWCAGTGPIRFITLSISTLYPIKTLIVPLGRFVLNYNTRASCLPVKDNQSEKQAHANHESTCPRRATQTLTNTPRFLFCTNVWPKILRIRDYEHFKDWRRSLWRKRPS